MSIINNMIAVITISHCFILSNKFCVFFFFEREGCYKYVYRNRIHLTCFAIIKKIQLMC